MRRFHFEKEGGVRDLLCVVEKELATRGLGVPVDRRIE